MKYAVRLLYLNGGGLAGRQYIDCLLFSVCSVPLW